MFYLPFTLARTGDVLTIEFDARIYVNKKALEFIAEDVNRSKKQGGKLNLDSDRIIYITQEKTALSEKLNMILAEITHFFSLDKSLSIEIAERQVAKSLQVHLSNNCYVSLFDSSDEALVNDYEEILSILESADSPGKASREIVADEVQDGAPGETRTPNTQVQSFLFQS